MAEKPASIRGVHEWAVTIEGKKQVLIPRVPEHLRSRKALKNCFDPVMVSLGPYHYGKENLKGMEKYKLDAVKRYTNCINHEYSNAQLYFDEFRDVAANARNYYDIPTDFGDEKFTWVMFMDSCFILDFIGGFIEASKSDTDGTKPTNNENEEENSSCAWLRMRDCNLVARDFTLLENQLPLKLLEKLMAIKARHSRLSSLESSISSCGQGNNTKKELVTMDDIKNFVASLLGKKYDNEKKTAANNKKIKQGDVPDQEIIHLLSLCREEFLEEKRQDPPRRLNLKSFYHRSVKELLESGIGFEASKIASKPGSTITCKNYKVCVKVYLPHIIVDDMTKYLFSNMIAYELGLCTGPSSYSPYSSDFISYVCFMDALIDHEEDVKILRRKGILLNALGSDQEVAHLFNELATDLSPKHDAYADIKQLIGEHCESKWKYWFANLYHTRIRSPWTLVALISAIFLLVLTAMQTFYSHRQVVYAAREWKNASAHPP